MQDEVLTPRLILRLMPFQFLKACVSGDLATAEKIIGFGLSEEILSSKHWMGIRINDLQTDPYYWPWSLRAIALASSRTMIGTIGFHSRPNPEYLRPFVGDGIELRYGVFSASRRQGFAQEAIRGLTGWALAMLGFAATTRPCGTRLHQIHIARIISFLRAGAGIGGDLADYMARKGHTSEQDLE